MTHKGCQSPLFQERCESCGSLVDVQVHHIDGHHSNNDPANRMMLCQQCHAAVHRTPGVVRRERVAEYCRKDREKQEKKQHLKGVHAQAMKARREGKEGWDRLLREASDHRVFDRAVHLQPPD